MGDKWHFIVSLVKSMIRIVSCILTFIYEDAVILVIGFGTAELLGILEELLDKRK